MRRLLLVTAIALAAAPTLASESRANPSAQGGVHLSGFICHPSLDPIKRAVSVTAVMPTITGTVRLQIRFQLESRAAGVLAAVRGGDLGHWISPNPITLGQQPGDVWIVSKPVTGVPVPASYRFKVTFRWIGAGGRVLNQAVRLGPTCHQPDMRPDPLVRSVTVEPVAAAQSVNQYVAMIGNSGLTAAASVDVLFQPGGGAPAQLITISRLRSHATRAETFTGPACTSATAPTVTVDPYDRIDDLNRANNSLTAVCPALPAQMTARTRSGRMSE